MGRPTEYERAKRLLNRGRHPGFVGRQLVTKAASNGGLFLFQTNGEDVGVAVMSPRRNVLLVLNVLPEWRGYGIGEWIIGYLRPNFVRAVEHAVPFFLRCGYTEIGQWKEGISLRTRVLVRKNIPMLAGRLAKVLDESGQSTAHRGKSREPLQGHPSKQYGESSSPLRVVGRAFRSPETKSPVGQHSKSKHSSAGPKHDTRKSSRRERMPRTSIGVMG